MTPVSAEKPTFISSLGLKSINCWFVTATPAKPSMKRRTVLAAIGFDGKIPQGLPERRVNGPPFCQRTFFFK